MSALLRETWPWQLLAALLGAAITYSLLTRRSPTPTPPQPQPQAETQAPEGADAPEGEPRHVRKPAGPAFSRAMEVDEPADVVPEGGLDGPERGARRVPEPAGTVFSRRMCGGEAAEAVMFGGPAQLPPREFAQVGARDETTGSVTCSPGGRSTTAAPAAVVPPPRAAPSPAVSRLMEPAEPGTAVEVADVAVGAPAGRYGPGSVDAVAHQGPPDGFTIKATEPDMVFHTPDSPYYGRTRPTAWFRGVADAERAGFRRCVHRPHENAQN